MKDTYTASFISRQLRQTASLFLLIFPLAFTPAGAQSPFIQAVDEYVPAPGQFVNTLPEATTDDTPESMALKCTQRLSGGAGQLVTLGAYGGYITFHFDHPVANVEGQRDFAVWGNANQNGAEPAIVMVAVDANNNGKADDPWYELKGSEHDNPLTMPHYTISYTYSPMQDVAWTDSRGTTGSVPRNGFHKQEYFPLWLTAQGTLTFSGTLLPSNATLSGSVYLLEAYDYGYADNKPNSDAEGNALDIGWAVDANGTPVSLTHIDFVRCYTALNQVCGWIGETSSEISGAEDLHLETSLALAASIREVAAPAPDASVCHDLQGRPVSHPRRGLYILKGKKLFINH